jgi:hypothetical protein
LLTIGEGIEGSMPLEPEERCRSPASFFGSNPSRGAKVPVQEPNRHHGREYHSH